MTHHLGYAKHDYQGKAQKDTLDDFINHHTDDNLLDDEQPSAKEENIQSADDKAKDPNNFKNVQCKII